jgi:hypothetical protein
VPSISSTWRWATCSSAVALLAAVPARAGSLVGVDEALARAFPPPAVTVERRLYLDDEQARRVEGRAGSPLPSRIVTCYVARAGAAEDAAPAGHACVDTHLVRSLPETVLVAVDAGGRVLQVEVLAFDEPPDYLPSERWIAQLHGRELDDELALKRGIRVLSGATLSSRALVAAVRRTLALGELLPPGKTPP